MIVGNILKINREKLLDEENKNFHYRYTIVFIDSSELSKDNIENVDVTETYVNIIDLYSETKSRTVSTGKALITTHHTYYYISYKDSDTNVANSESITLEIYNKIKIGDSYLAEKTSTHYKNGTVTNTYKLIYN